MEVDKQVKNYYKKEL